MTASDVYFTDMSVNIGDTLPAKLERVARAAGICDLDMEKKFVAIKMHFGELGNLASLRPNYAKVLVDIVKECGGLPFLTDSNTLYVGSRKHALEHLDTANLNGFSPMSTGCQILIADGLKGTDDVEIPVDGEYVKAAKIGRAVADADVIITLNHFKCHELTGFGGALKNLAMGCASRAGKMDMHSAGKPVIDHKLCRGCGKCIQNCAQDAITITDKKATIDKDKCAGCGRCIGACHFDAITADMDQDESILNAKIVEYAKAVVQDKPNFHVTVIADVSPFCDCHAENDMPIVPNVGILASYDPVALDMACIDLVQKQPIIKGSLLDRNCHGVRPDDLIKCTHPNTNWQSTFTHAAKVGFGNNEYKLIIIK